MLFYKVDQVICVGAFVDLGPIGLGRDTGVSRSRDRNVLSSLGDALFKLESLILAQIERWWHA